MEEAPNKAELFRARPARLGAWGLLLAGLLALLLGCRGPGAPATEGTTLTFVHGKVLGPSDPLPGLLQEFEARHPGVRVRQETLPSSTDEQHQFYLINLEARTPFDVIAVDVIWVPEFVRAGWLRDLSEVFPPGERPAFLETPREAASVDGRPYGVPWLMDAGVLFYRVDLLARYGFEPPETYAELARQARAIMEGEQDPRLAGFLWQGKQYEGMVVNAFEQIWANGGRVLAPDGRVTVERPEVVEALGFMRRLITSGASPGWVTAADEELSRRSFNAGRAVFHRNWPYAIDLFEARDSPIRGKVGMTRLPRHPGGERVSALGGWSLTIPRGSRHPEAAWELISFLTGEHAQKAMALGAGFKPTRHALYQDPELTRYQPYLPSLYPLMQAARPRPVTPYYLMISQILQPEWSAVLVGIKSPEAAVASAKVRLLHLLGQSR